MSSGSTHDKVTSCLTLILIIGSVILIFLYPSTLSYNTPLIIVSFAFAGYMFNGDLDIWSEPTKRWGILHYYWWPYRRLFNHRGISHWPIIGTLTRLAYASPIIIILVYYTYSPTPLQWSMILSGLELGALSHIIADEIS
jgi:uncharacterized metal-binding protein